MKRKWVLIVGIIIGVLAIASVVYYIYYLSMPMHPAQTGAIQGTNIVAVENGGNNVYLLNTKDGYLMFDAGANRDELIQSLNQLSVRKENVKYIFLTHSDYDHVAALNEFSNAVIYMGAKEKQMVDGTTRRSEQGSNHLPGVQIQDVTLWNQGDKLEINGHTVEGVEAPGHTPGSMMYRVDGKYLFSGDAFRIMFGKTSVHPYSMDENTSKATIDGMEQILEKSEFVLTGHYGYFQHVSN